MRSATLVRLMAYTGLRPQEALALHWYAVRENTLLVELANADGELERLKNRKRSRKRSRTVDLMGPVQEELEAFRRACGDPGDDQLVFPHELHGVEAEIRRARQQVNPRPKEHLHDGEPRVAGDR